MALNPKRSAAAANAAADAFAALLNGGTIKFYDGSQPAGPDTAITTQNLLATAGFGNPAFAGASGGTATANAITGGTISASGTASWFRAASSGGSAHWDGTVGTANADCIVPTTTFTSGVTLNVTSAKIVETL